jgi:hypothetical protein
MKLIFNYIDIILDDERNYHWRVKMKKTIFIMILGMVFTTMQIMAQSKPCMGYDKVAWGASTADVIKAYNLPSDDGISIAGYGSEEDSNIWYALQENVSDSIEKRAFYFNRYTGKSQLYQVVVQYTKGSNGSTLSNLLLSRYGKVTDVTNNRKLGIGYSVITTKNYIYGNFSPDI